VHARTDVRVPNNRLPLSLGMLRAVQIVPTLRTPLSRNFPGVLPRRAHRHTERTAPRLCVSGIHVTRVRAANSTSARARAAQSNELCETFLAVRARSIIAQWISAPHWSHLVTRDPSILSSPRVCSGFFLAFLTRVAFDYVIVS